LRQKRRRTSKSLAGVKPGRPRRCILLQWPCAAAQKHISFSAAQAQATFPSSMRALAKPEIAAVWPWASVVGRCRRGRRRPSLRLGDKRANARRDGLRVARHPRLLKVLGGSSRVSSACYARLARAHAGRRVVCFGIEQENTKPNRMATNGITHRLHARPLDASCTAWRGVAWAMRVGTGRLSAQPWEHTVMSLYDNDQVARSASPTWLLSTRGRHNDRRPFSGAAFVTASGLSAATIGLMHRDDTPRRTPRLFWRRRSAPSPPCNSGRTSRSRCQSTSRTTAAATVGWPNHSLRGMRC
jgi:hypothetical protein